MPEMFETSQLDDCHEPARRLLETLLPQCRPGWSLPQPFYSAESLYQWDVEHIWRKEWLFAGHSSQIPKAGDYFTVSVGNDSLIIIRSKEGAVHALHNVCRHRG